MYTLHTLYMYSQGLSLRNPPGGSRIWTRFHTVPSVRSFRHQGGRAADAQTFGCFCLCEIQEIDAQAVGGSISLSFSDIRAGDRQTLILSLHP